jgi:hypothetical protein
VHGRDLEAGGAEARLQRIDRAAVTLVGIEPFERLRVVREHPLERRVELAHVTHAIGGEREHAAGSEHAPRLAQGGFGSFEVVDAEVRGHEIEAPIAEGERGAVAADEVRVRHGPSLALLVRAPQTFLPWIDPHRAGPGAQPLGQLEQREARATSEIERSRRTEGHVLEQQPPGERGPQWKLVVDLDVSGIGPIEWGRIGHGAEAILGEA